MKRPEVLAPAGDRASMDAAIRAGADAVYFGLTGFNARARATNFDAKALGETMAHLHAHGVRGYVTLNTLLFDDELDALENAVRACADAAVDAVIVQDIGVMKLVRAIAPGLPIHASTQMTCTDAGSVKFAASLGATRVIVARELSVADIASIHRDTKDAIELEAFVHGALCVSYSGQCLTSEAIGGRSANRGACAQACRLPYDLVVDGAARDLGDVAYLLSPEDLEASALVPELQSAGVVSLKIEGRLKGPAYVAATTTLYRDAIAGAASEDTRKTALATYTRGSGPGFLAGVDHQRLVEGRACDHRGLEIGIAERREEAGGRAWIAVTLSDAIARGDGVLVEGGREGKGEIGGRVWGISSPRGGDLASANAGERAKLWLGPDKSIGDVESGRRVFRTDDPKREKEARAETTTRKRPLAFALRGAIGERPTLSATTEDGRCASVEVETNVERARAKSDGDAHARIAEKLGRLGDSPFEIGTLAIDLPVDAFVAPSALNTARRAVLEKLGTRASHTTTNVRAKDLVAAARAPIDRAPPPGGLFVLARNLGQARAAIESGADGIVLDFLELTGTGNAVRALRAEGAKHITLTPPRITKPGEEKILSYLLSLEPDALLVRGLGDLLFAHEGPAKIGDFSLNVTNRISAREVLSRGLRAFTPAFDLDATQLVSLLSTGLAPFGEVVLHHPMPLFHTEHCVFAALLSDGRDHKTCGRPCERHEIALRDRAGMDHPVIADVGCRNTVFHARAQSAADITPQLQALGVTRFRIELVRETPEQTSHTVRAYRDLLAGRTQPADLRRALRTDGGYGVVRGSLRVLNA